VEDELKPMFFGITPGMLVGKFGPSPRFLLQGEAGQQKTDSGKGEGLFGGIFVAEGVQNQRGSGESRLNDGLQIRGPANSNREKKEPSKKRGSI
jgi:hypothetical protein